MSDSPFPLKRGLDEFRLCRKLEDCASSSRKVPKALSFYETVSAGVFLRSCITDPEQDRKLRLWLQAKKSDDVIQQVAKSLVAGDLVVAILSADGSTDGKGIIRSSQGGGSRANPAQTTPRQDEAAARQQASSEDVIVLGEPEPETTWIEIELVHPDGKPAANERYKLTMPDGSVKWGRLDGNGKARVERLQPGNCQVTFPDRDEQVWDVG